MNIIFDWEVDYGTSLPLPSQCQPKHWAMNYSYSSPYSASCYDEDLLPDCDNAHTQEAHVVLKMSSGDGI